MTPKAKVVLYGLLLSVLLVAMIVTAVALIYHCIGIAITGSASVIATTFFASSSKFAKEVWNKIEYCIAMHCSIDEYPQTPGQKLIAREESYRELKKLAKAVNQAQNQQETLLLCKAKSMNPQQKKFHQNRRDKTARVLKIALSEFSHKWKIFSRNDTLPIDPSTHHPWNDPATFLECMRRYHLALAYA